MTNTLSFDVHLDAPFDEAIDTVTARLKAEGFGVLTRIDVQSTFKDRLGVEFRPYAILGACNPPLAHRALERDACAGLLLPCNVTVESDPAGGVLVRIADPQTMLGVSGLEDDATLAAVASQARERLVRVAEGLRTPM
jgi:uncharacterized protein (DUF302 family)